MRKGSAIERLKASRGYHERLRQESREAWRDTAYRSADYRLDSPNTLPPPEDVVEERRRRKHVVTGGAARSNPAESLFLLAFLVASIYGIYRLIVYVLAQG